MIQPATENKYRFNMQVSARAMGSRDRSPPATGRRRGAIDFRGIRPTDRVGARESPVEADRCAKLLLLRKRITDP
jgi:hypothetical protein